MCDRVQRSENGSTFILLGLICTALLTIFISLLIRQVGWQLEDHLCNSFGSYVFGSCGMNVITDFLATRKIVLLNCWTKTKFTCIGG